MNSGWSEVPAPIADSGVSAVVTAGVMRVKPAPKTIFGPVWTVLSVLIDVSSWLAGR
jgi:hypothetical protein